LASVEHAINKTPIMHAIKRFLIFTILSLRAVYTHNRVKKNKNRGRGRNEGRRSTRGVQCAEYVARERESLPGRFIILLEKTLLTQYTNIEPEGRLD